VIVLDIILVVIILLVCYVAAEMHFRYRKDRK
jgi:hypothetical protein